MQTFCWWVERMPRAGESIQASALRLELGGKGLNVAVGMARLGARIEVLLGCGNDHAGEAALNLLHSEGISTRNVHRMESPSGHGAGLITPDGQSFISIFPGANALLDATHIEQARADLCSASMVNAQFETAMPVIVSAFALAHAHGVPTVLNPSPWQEPDAALKRTTHTLIVNETEAAQLANHPRNAPPAEPEIWECALASIWSDWITLQRIVITLGSRGSLALVRPEAEADSTFIHSHAPIITCVDSTGAGDAFSCGYLWASLQKQPLIEALRWGNYCGAHVAAKRGVIEVLPSADDAYTWFKASA